MPLTRRALLSSAALAAAPGSALIDTHVHLFDPRKFPYHAAATYKPPPETLDAYLPSALAIGLKQVVIVHPEPYQDDHRYLEYCFELEPSKGFFKGTCLLDALKTDTPQRMREMAHKWPGRIVALRVHAVGNAWESSGPIRNRDLSDKRMYQTWAAATKLGIAIQMHMIPMHAPAVAKLIQATPGCRVIIDHLGRYGQGTPPEYERVLRLAESGRVYMKFSGLEYSSKQPPPHAELQPLIKRIHDAFGPDRIIWGGLGMTVDKHIKQREAFETLWSFSDEETRRKIRGLNASLL